MFGILFSIVIWAVVGIALMRFLPVFGINPVGKIKLLPKRQGEKTSVEIMLGIFIMALLFRISMYGIGFISAVLMQRPKEITLDFFLNVWNRWDAPRYISIAEKGYTGMLEDGEPLNCVFFPLYPWLVKIFRVIIPDTRIACLLVSTLAYSAAMPFMYAFICRDYGKKIAELACIYLSVAPFTFFLGGMMSESVFLLTCVLTWYFINEKKWIAAGIAGLFCALSRSVGVLIAIPYALELMEYNSSLFIEKKYKQWFLNCLKQGIWIFLIPCGVVIYLMINYRYTGDCFKFMEYQQRFWLHTSCYFGQGIQTMWNDTLSSGRDWISKADLFMPQTLSYTFAALLMLLCCRRHKSSYVLYYAAYFIFNTGITWSMSGARYAALALPLYIMLAERTEKSRAVSLGIVVLSAMLHAVYFTMYLAGHQIM